MKKNYYTVYENRTDYIVACGNADECAKQLNMTLPSFYCAVYRSRNGMRNKYTVIIESLDDSENNDDLILI